MYEILHGDQVIVRDENIDLYLAVLKGGFISILRDLYEGNWRFSEYFIYVVTEMLEYHIKDVETGKTVDVLDNVFPKDVFSPNLCGFFVLRNFKNIRLDDNIRRSPRYYYDLKPGQFEETYDYHRDKIYGVAPKKYNDLNLMASQLPKVLKDIKKEPWYYTEDLIDGFQRYATYYKDELIGRSTRPFSHLLKHMAEMYSFGIPNEDKINKLKDIYIKDLLSGEVLNDYRNFDVIEKVWYDWEDDLGNDGWDDVGWWTVRLESECKYHWLTKGDISIISKEFDWSQKYGSQINEE